MGHWAMSCSRGNEDVDATCDCPPAHAMRHLILMTFSCFKGLGLASFHYISLKHKEVELRRESLLQWWR